MGRTRAKCTELSGIERRVIDRAGRRNPAETVSRSFLPEHNAIFTRRSYTVLHAVCARARARRLHTVYDGVTIPGRRALSPGLSARRPPETVKSRSRLISVVKFWQQMTLIHYRGWQCKNKRNRPVSLGRFIVGPAARRRWRRKHEKEKDEEE